MGDVAVLSVRSLAGLEVVCEAGGEGGTVILLLLLEEPGLLAPPSEGFASIMRRCISRDIFLLELLLLVLAGVSSMEGIAGGVALRGALRVDTMATGE